MFERKSLGLWTSKGPPFDMHFWQIFGVRGGKFGQFLPNPEFCTEACFYSKDGRSPIIVNTPLNGLLGAIISFGVLVIESGLGLEVVNFGSNFLGYG